MKFLLDYAILPNAIDHKILMICNFLAILWSFLVSNPKTLTLSFALFHK